METPGLLANRLTTATDSSDARAAIASFCDLFAQMEDATLLSEASNLTGLYDFMDNALSLITKCKLKNNTTVLEGSSEVCQLFILLLTSPSTSVHTRTKLADSILSFRLTRDAVDQDRGIVASLLDMMYDMENVVQDVVARTLCVQFLTILFKLKSQVFEQAVIETPAGLNRLVDLLTSDESICDESVRNEVLLLLTGMVEKSEVVRKLVAFSEGFDRLFSIIEHESGLTGGSIVVQDALKLINFLARDDGVTLLYQSKVAMAVLPTLLDITTASAWVYRNVEGPGMTDDDDAHIAALLGQSSSTSAPEELPRASLKPSEEKIICLSLQTIKSSIVDAPSESKPERQQYLASIPPLANNLYKLAIFTPPKSPSSYDPIPPPEIQNLALDVLSFICNGAPELLKEEIAATVTTPLLNIAISPSPSSTSAVTTLRCLLTPNTSSTFIMHALAPPPPPMDDDGMEVEITQPIVKQIIADLSHSLSTQAPSSSINVIGASKSLFALLNSGGEAAKEILLRIPPSLLQTLVTHISSSASSSESDETWLALLTLLCEWCSGCPTAVHSFLSFPDSIALLKLLKADNVKQNGLVTLLFGMCLEHFGEDEHAGWTRQTILELIQSKVGISNFTNMLEAARKTYATSSSSSLDSQLTQTWFSGIADSIRRRIVKEVTSGSSNVEEENPLNSLIQQQVKEIEELKKELEGTIKLKDDAEAVNSSLRTKLNVVVGGDNVTNVEEEARLKRAEETLTTQVQDLNSLLTTKEGEIDGLNKMYQALEVELRNVKSFTPTTNSEDSNGEIEKLKEKLRQGDKWMRMAQEKMEELGARNIELEDIASQGGAGNGVATNESSLLENERIELDRLKDNARSADAWMQAANAQIEELTSDNERLRSSGTNETGGGTNDKALLDEIAHLRSEKDDFVELVAKMQTEEGEEITKLRTNLKSADEWMTSAQKNLEILGEENKRLEEALLAKGSGEESSSVELESLRKEKQEADAKIAKLKANSLSADDWMSAAQKNLESLGEENQKLLANVNEISSLVETLKREKEEIEQKMNITVTSLQDDVNALTSQNMDLKEKLSDPSTNVSTPTSQQHEHFDSIDLSSPSPTQNGEDNTKLRRVMSEMEEKLKLTESTAV
ncbi:hypothetical protein TrRE_jg10454, partial [Triparma retinervis]